MAMQTSTGEGGEWFSAEQRSQRHQLWQVCEGQREALTALLKRTLGQVAALGGSRANHGAVMDAAGLSAALRECLTGDMRPLETEVSACAARLAQAGASLHDVFSVVEGLRREGTHWIIKRHAGQPAPLESALQVLQRLCDRMLEAVATAYVAHGEQLLDQQRRTGPTGLLWLQRLSESGLLGILVCDVHGGIKDANETFAAMVGYSREELTSGAVRWSEMTPPEWAALDVEAVTQLAATGRTRPWEKEYYRKDGSRVPVMVGVATLVDDEVVAFTLDTTERKRAEELRVRSIALQSENSRIQEASRLKSEFLANMSHELRTPLNSIIGFADLLHDGEIATDSPQHHEFLGDILKSGRHLLQLINDVLDLAKIEAGKMEFRPERTDLGRLFGEVLDVLRSIAGANGIEIACKVEPAAHEVVLDPARLKQVLYNYLSNALKFTPPGGRVLTRASLVGGDRLLIEVEDTGPGISAHDLERLFIEFEQLDHGSAKRHAGTGLGLALTKRIVEAQEGSVGVRSTLGKGSTFWAMLPKQSRVPARDQLATLPERYDDAALVLVVEDDPVDQQLIVRALNGAGYGVELAETGKQAIDACQRRGYDAITLDLLLPDVSGLHVLRELRSAGLNQRTPVIVVSVVAEQQVVHGFSIYDYISKPVESSRLLTSLELAGITPEKPGTILVIDDDASSLKLMRTTLSRLGYQVECQADAARALESAHPRRHSAVILDLLMPGMDGFEFLRRFRDDPECREIPVIIWTTKDLTVDDHRRLKRHAQAVFEKGSGRPLSLVEELKMLLQTHPAPEGVRAP
jgi:PAS domain S-box-containing protein